MWPEAMLPAWRHSKVPFSIRYISQFAGIDPVQDPSFIAFFSDSASGQSAVEDLDVLRVPVLSWSLNRAAASESGLFSGRYAKEEASFCSIWSRVGDGFMSRWHRTDPSPKPVPGAQCLVYLSETLRNAGFIVPAFTDSELNSFSSGWEVQLVLDLTHTGIPEHVLVEKSSGNRDIDRMVYLKVLGGKAGPGAVRGGRVNVSYGTE